MYLGVRTRVRGAPPPAGTGALIVANHVSWLDIGVIGAERELAFVAKSEVGEWPVVGFLANLQRTLYIDRQRRSATAGMAATMGARIANGEEVVLFAEGTTGDGTRILPFRSSLLGAAHQAMGAMHGRCDQQVYPLTLTYTGWQGLPGGRGGRASLAWYGDTQALWPSQACAGVRRGRCRTGLGRADRDGPGDLNAGSDAAGGSLGPQGAPAGRHRPGGGVSRVGPPLAYPFLARPFPRRPIRSKECVLETRSTPMKKVHIKSFGCQMNVCDRAAHDRHPEPSGL